MQLKRLSDEEKNEMPLLFKLIDILDVIYHAKTYELTF
jgi:hypothetical protein